MAGAVPRSGREGKTRAGTVLGYAPRLSLPISQSANTSRAWFGWKFVHQTICRGVSIQMSRYTYGLGLEMVGPLGLEPRTDGL
jgi:hypothetical protein